MATDNTTTQTNKTTKAVWSGRVISGILVTLLTLSAASKFMLVSTGGEPLDEMLNHLGLEASLLLIIGVIELISVVFYAIPKTAIVGSILLTGYMGGAIFAHLRVGDPPVPQVIIAVLVWLGIFLRDERLRQILPLRNNAE